MPRIDAAIGERSLVPLSELQRRLDAGEATVWRGARSALYLRRIFYPESSELVMEAGPAEGDMEEILAAVPHLEAWARSIGCTQVHVYAGRAGWERALRAQDYGLYQIVLRKILS